MPYKNIAVDEETYRRVMMLCKAYEMGGHSKGALVKKLVNAEYNKLAAVKLLPVAEVETPAQA